MGLKEGGVGGNEERGDGRNWKGTEREEASVESAKRGKAFARVEEVPELLASHSAVEGGIQTVLEHVRVREFDLAQNKGDFQILNPEIKLK